MMGGGSGIVGSEASAGRMASLAGGGRSAVFGGNGPQKPGLHPNSS